MRLRNNGRLLARLNDQIHFYIFQAKYPFRLKPSSEIENGTIFRLLARLMVCPHKFRSSNGMLLYIRKATGNEVPAANLYFV